MTAEAARVEPLPKPYTGITKNPLALVEPDPLKGRAFWSQTPAFIYHSVQGRAPNRKQPAPDPGLVSTRQENPPLGPRHVLAPPSLHHITGHPSPGSKSCRLTHPLSGPRCHQRGSPFRRPGANLRHGSSSPVKWIRPVSGLPLRLYSRPLPPWLKFMSGRCNDDDDEGSEPITNPPPGTDALRERGWNRSA